MVIPRTESQFSSPSLLAAPHLLYLLYPLCTTVKHLGFVDWQRITFNLAHFVDLVENRAPGSRQGRGGDRAPCKLALLPDSLCHTASTLQLALKSNCQPGLPAFWGLLPINIALGRHAVYLCTALGWACFKCCKPSGVALGAARACGIPAA